MKKYLFPIIILLAVSIGSCDKKEVLLFNGSHEIYFQKFYMNAIAPGREQADSTTMSFFFYPDGTSDVLVPLTVNLSGPLLTSDVRFGLKVVPELTTATPDEYTLDPSYTFRAQEVPEGVKTVTDIIQIKMHRSTRLAQMPAGVRLVVELIPGETVGLGQAERVRATIILTTRAIRPAWWTEDIERTLFGKYTEKKYKYFLNEIDKNAEMSEELIRNRPDQAIKLVMQFKTWLLEQNPPIYEEDGSLMEVGV